MSIESIFELQHYKYFVNCTGNTEWSVLDSVRGGPGEDWATQASSEMALDSVRWPGMGELGECHFSLAVSYLRHCRILFQAFKWHGNHGQRFFCCLMLRGSWSISIHGAGSVSQPPACSVLIIKDYFLHCGPLMLEKIGEDVKTSMSLSFRETHRISMEGLGLCIQQAFQVCS